LEYDTGFFLAIPPGTTGTVVGGGAMTTRTNTQSNGKRMRGDKIDGMGDQGKVTGGSRGTGGGMGGRALNGLKEEIAAGTVLGRVHTPVC
jgi:hypothetical protein